MSRSVVVTALACSLTLFQIAGAAASSYTVTGSYSASTSTHAAGTPTISDSLPAAFSETLAVGGTTGQLNFLTVAPTSGSGLVTGSVDVEFSYVGPSGSAVTGVSSTVGANQATFSGGMVDIAANYAINYTTQTDCITWDGTCTPSSGPVTTKLTDTLAISFADGAVLDVGLYDWSDWNMQPGISFTLASGPTPQTPTAPEPASLALFGAGVASLAVIRRRRGAGAR
jgi:hypothetical protein